VALVHQYIIPGSTSGPMVKIRRSRAERSGFRPIRTAQRDSIGRMTVPTHTQAPPSSSFRVAQETGEQVTAVWLR